MYSKANMLCKQHCMYLVFLVFQYSPWLRAVEKYKDLENNAHILLLSR